MTRTLQRQLYRYYRQYTDKFVEEQSDNGNSRRYTHFLDAV